MPRLDARGRWWWWWLEGVNVRTMGPGAVVQRMYVGSLGSGQFLSLGQASFSVVLPRAMRAFVVPLVAPMHTHLFTLPCLW